MKITTPFAMAAALGIALTATASYAREVRVSYGDLNLATAEGQKKLERRLDQAARQACGFDEMTTGTRLRSAKTLACYKEAHAKARNDMALAIENERLGG
ncbi:UrcA family protein [Novosphingobium album (ex Liu et al. 2023)]|uniref:UrcA family protein n=1 Tax=Novosphingobium album (ex Liu et al. 2023) TaxID=3031130 RepID=A0ABT5WPE6_9SPHN|nr:UrcA family protein [Novosphingobium album (ex Liu et al. 2023)]MDE8651749.1 UrcA family protein [Novosphingobium album (ex Liu et al. 2023)]